MTIVGKIIGSIVGLVLVFAGGVDFMATTAPGLAILAVCWTIPTEKK